MSLKPEEKRLIERIFELGIGSLDDPKTLELPETKSLLKLVANMPFLLTVADYGYDPELAFLCVERFTIEEKMRKRIAEITREEKNNGEPPS